MNQSDWPAHLLILNNWELNQWLSQFVLEIRRHDEKEYPVNTWYQICCGILYYIWELKRQLDIFFDAAFASFCQALDAEMKRLKAGGLRVHTKPITPDIVEHFGVSLWNVFHSQKCERALRLEAALI